MITSKRIISGLTLFLFLNNIHAQRKEYEYTSDKNDTLIHDVRLYGGFVHQHQDFLNKAFSFQGIETGVILNHSLLAGAFGSLFVSNLDVKVAVYPHLFVNIKEGGLFVGSMKNDTKVLHTGWLLNMGYFSLNADNENFAIFNDQHPIIGLSGLVLSPQVFAEMNITNWMKLRTGLSYSFYSFEDQSTIKKTDLNNLSLIVGFIFGKFK